jgi:putative Mn2+ efflux pump MntP
MEFPFEFKTILEILIVGLVLSIDSFLAAVAMGHRPFTRKDALRFAFSSGGAEGLATLVGALAGAHLISKLEAWDHWIAFTLLIAVALHMAWEGIEHWRGDHDEEAPEKKEFHSFARILVVSFATSMDAFGVGIGLGVAQKPIKAYVISIAIWAFTSTIAGLLLARKLSDRFGPIMHFVGAVVLAILAFQMLKI